MNLTKANIVESIATKTDFTGKQAGETVEFLLEIVKLQKKGGSDHYSQISTTTIVKDHVIDAKLLKYKN